MLPARPLPVGHAMALVHAQLAGALALALLSLPAVGAEPDVIEGRALVVDGDTLEIAGRQLRLAGIDAPELDQLCSSEGDVLAAGSTFYRCGDEAAAALADRIGSDPIACKPQTANDSAVLVAICRLNDEDLGAWIVRSGWARAYPVGRSIYISDEKLAQGAREGIWSGDFLNPWDWRRQQRAATESKERRLKVVVDAANVRAEPSRHGRFLATLRRDTVVEQLEQSGAWYRVRPFQGPPGWIFGQLLEPVQPDEDVDR